MGKHIHGRQRFEPCARGHARAGDDDLVDDAVQVVVRRRRGGRGLLSLGSGTEREQNGSAQVKRDVDHPCGILLR